VLVTLSVINSDG